MLASFTLSLLTFPGVHLRRMDLQTNHFLDSGGRTLLHCRSLHHSCGRWAEISEAPDSEQKSLTILDQLSHRLEDLSVFLRQIMRIEFRFHHLRNLDLRSSHQHQRRYITPPASAPLCNSTHLHLHHTYRGIHTHRRNLELVAVPSFFSHAFHALHRDAFSCAYLSCIFSKHAGQLQIVAFQNR